MATQLHQEFKYYDTDTNSVAQISVALANVQTGSLGTVTKNVGPLSYDRYNRFHPFGTTEAGTDLLTELVYVIRVYAFTGSLALVLASGLGLLGTLLPTHERLGERLLAAVSSILVTFPLIPTIYVLSYMFSQSWIADLYSGAVLYALLFAGFGWIGVRATIQPLAAATTDATWTIIAQHSGQRRRAVFQHHVFPMLIGPLLVYGLFAMSGIMIATTALGRLVIVTEGVKPYTVAAVASWGGAPMTSILGPSWHVTAIPAATLTISTAGFASLAVALRGALHDRFDADNSVPGETDATGGGG